MGYPRAQRAIAEVIEEAMEKAGETRASLNRKLKRHGQFMGRVLSLEQEPTATELMAIGRALGTTGSILLRQAEVRVKTLS